MSITERRVWLASHQAPPGMLLVDVREMAMLEQTIKAGAATFELLAHELGPYFVAHERNTLAAVKAVVAAAARLRTENEELRAKLAAVSPPPA